MARVNYTSEAMAIAAARTSKIMEILHICYDKEISDLRNAVYKLPVLEAEHSPEAKELKELSSFKISAATLLRRMNNTVSCSLLLMHMLPGADHSLITGERDLKEFEKFSQQDAFQDMEARLIIDQLM